MNSKMGTRRGMISCVLATAVFLAAGLAGAAPDETCAAPVDSITTGSAGTSATAGLILDKAQKKPSPYWTTAVARFVSEETTAPRGGTVLLGDSITARWPAGMFPADKVINRGIGGDHIGGWNYLGLLDRLPTSVEVLKPRQVYLLIGVNDMLQGGPPMDNMVAAYGYLLDELHRVAPDARIIVQSLLPVSKPEFEYMHDPIIELNGHIAKLAAARGLRYVDLYSAFADDKGKLKPGLDVDGIHLSPKGYELWLDVLKREGLLPAD